MKVTKDFCLNQAFVKKTAGKPNLCVDFALSQSISRQRNCINKLTKAKRALLFLGITS